MWLWLKDHPEKGSRHIAASLKEKPADISSALNTLFLRDMVSKKLDTTKPRGFLWSAKHTNEGFYLRPKRKQDKSRRLSTPPQETLAKEKPEVLETFDMVLGGFPEKPQFDVTKLPLQEAHEVYLQLKSYFEPKVL